MTTLLGRAITLGAMFGLLTITTGCGALSAMANPKVMWALKDPAPMSVVVRRADAAELTAKEVDRLLTSTPADPTDDWLKSVGPKPEDSAQDLKALTQDPLYMKSHARVVAAEVWLRQLGDLKGDGTGQGNLLAIVSSDLGDQYAAIVAKEAEVGALDVQIESEKAARDAKGVSDADKKAHDKNVDDLKKQKSAKEDEVDPLKKKFLAAVSDAAAKTPADARDAVAPALVNLRQAVEDATIADGAAAVRYPLAVPTLKDSVTDMVPVYVADIIEEQTGKRPTMQGFSPGISLDGTDVSVTLNGLSKDDLGKISLGELTTQTIVRTKDWVVHTLALLGAISSTKDHLGFEQDTLDALLDGFAKNGWKRIDPVLIPEATDPKVLAATAKIRPHRKATAAPPVGVAEAQPAKATPANAAAPTKPAPATKGAPKAPTPPKKGTALAAAPTAAPASPAPLPPSAAPMRPEDFNP